MNILQAAKSLFPTCHRALAELLPPLPRPHRRTLAVSETVFQFPPLRVNFPLPIRVRISSGVSLGPLANGVYLEINPHSLGGYSLGLHPGARVGQEALSPPLTSCS